MMRTSPAFLRSILPFALAAATPSCIAEVAEHDSAADIDLDAHSDALVTTASFAMRDVYRGHFNGQCSSDSWNARDIVGYEPSAAGTFPVFVYLTGTGMLFNGSDAQAMTQQMAARGFVAATVEYDNGYYPANCSAAVPKARCIFDATSSTSAIAKLCARAKADCSKGIVVSGFSQGANLGSLAKNYDTRVRAAYLLGHGHKVGGMDLTSCMQDSATALLPSQMRSVNGERDEFFGTNADGVRAQLQTVVGVSCPGAFNCLQANGSGWYIVKNTEVSDGYAEHCYFFQAGCAGALNAAWQTGTSAWALTANLNWLAAQATGN